ncbi:MAG: DNA alkylation repair protein [Spirochaetes bacterium]|jgi:3-methyladenine DNA glycosylase AlkD|nr:DNA alkylation repair protein [Spirochaetota bacterium]
MTKKCAEIIRKLKSLHNRKNAEGMRRFGIKSKNMLGISMPVLRRMAAETGKNHGVALELWDSGIHEAMILASLIADPELMSGDVIEKWIGEIDSWGICDQACLNLFWKIPSAHDMAMEWAGREEEYVRRAGFALMAVLAVHDRDSSDSRFSKFFPLIFNASSDERNFVKKAVNWALRQIGKRNQRLNREAINLAEKISRIDSRSARWIAADALRELKSKTFG